MQRWGGGEGLALNRPKSHPATGISLQSSNFPQSCIKCFSNANLQISFTNQTMKPVCFVFTQLMHACWSQGMRRESFSKRFGGKYDPVKVWAKFLKNTMPRTSVSNDCEVGVQMGKPPLRSHWDQRYFCPAGLRGWRDGHPHSESDFDR